MSDLHPVARCTMRPTWAHLPVMVYSLYHERSESWIEVSRRAPHRLEEEPVPPATLLAQVGVAAEEVEQELAGLHRADVGTGPAPAIAEGDALVLLEVWPSHSHPLRQRWTCLPPETEAIGGFVAWLTGKLSDLGRGMPQVQPSAHAS